MPRKEEIDQNPSHTNPEVFFGALPTPGLLYRGDSQPPDVVFENGFRARGTNYDVLSHVNHVGDTDWSPDSGFVATSQSREVAQKFPCDLVGCGKTFVYEMNTQPHGILAAKAVYSYVRSGQVDIEDFEIWRAEKEIAVPCAIRSQDIKGAWQVDYFNAGEEIVRVMRNSYISNPNYVPSVKMRSVHPTPSWVSNSEKRLGVSSDMASFAPTMTQITATPVGFFAERALMARARVATQQEVTKNQAQLSVL